MELTLQAASTALLAVLVIYLRSIDARIRSLEEWARKTNIAAAWEEIP